MNPIHQYGVPDSRHTTAFCAMAQPLRLGCARQVNPFRRTIGAGATGR